MSDISVFLPENFSVEEADKFRQEINELMNSGKRQFSIDFSRCTFIDSTGLGVLVGIHKRCITTGGRLELKALKPEVMRVFSLTRLDRVFDIRP